MVFDSDYLPPYRAYSKVISQEQQEEFPAKTLGGCSFFIVCIFAKGAGFSGKLISVLAAE